MRLDGQDDRTLTVFETTAGDFPEVMECYSMTGEADYQLRVPVRSLAVRRKPCYLAIAANEGPTLNCGQVIDGKKFWWTHLGSNQGPAD